MYKKEGVETLCKNGKERGLCPIGHVAPNIEANRFLDRYIVAKHLKALGNDKAEEIIFTELGLYDDAQTLIELEKIWNTSIKINNSKQQMMQHAKNYGKR